MTAVPETEFSDEFVKDLRIASDDFVRGMKARMDVSYFKYGPVASAYPDKVDAIGSGMVRLRWYSKGNAEKGIAPGNTEYLMDAANFWMIEEMCPRHPTACFESIARETHSLPLDGVMASLRLYANTGNTAHLRHAAWFAAIEFMHPRHPNAHFKGTDDDGSPGRIALNTGRADKRDNENIGESGLAVPGAS